MQYKIKSLILTTLLVFCLQCSVAQDVIIVDSVRVELSTIVTDSLDSINYAYVESAKPSNKTLVFIQGSGSIPLFSKTENTIIPMLPLELTKIVKKWNLNLVLVAPPGVECVEDSLILDQNYYKTDVNGWPIMKYRQGNRLDLYVKRYLSVLDHLSESNSNREFYVFGHSQGSRVAAVLANQNSTIKKIALASVNPISRSHEAISKIRLQHLSGEITFEKSQALIEKEYKRMRVLNSKENKNLEELSELSYTYPSLLEHILILNQPLRFIYGSHDLGTVMEADKIMLSFIEKGKSNLSTKVYNNMEHNFYEGDKYNWDQVFEDTINWFFNEN